MDDYLRDLYETVIYDILYKVRGPMPSKLKLCSDGLHTLAQETEGFDGITFKYNEEGRLHSKYLGDRYEPAIIIQRCYSAYYYLFDGEIKDCVHPFSITLYDSESIIRYYSSERIKQGLPTTITDYRSHVLLIYNGHTSIPLMAGYKHGSESITNHAKQNYLLHDCMDPFISFMPFKFAD